MAKERLALSIEGILLLADCPTHGPQALTPIMAVEILSSKTLESARGLKLKCIECCTDDDPDFHGILRGSQS